MADDAVREIHLWKDVLKPFLRRVKAQVRVALPGVVDVFDTATRYVTVEWKSPFRVGLTDVEDEPKTQRVPIWMPRGDGYGRHHDLAQGDNLYVVFSDRPQSRFWQDGQTDPPQTASTHNLAYGMAFPGGRRSIDGPVNSAGSCQDGAEDGSATTVWTRTRGAVLGVWRAQAEGECQVDGGDTVSIDAGTLVEIEAPEIKLGETATLAVALDQDPVQPDSNFNTMINSIAGVVNGIAPGTITPAQLAQFANAMGNVQASAVKAKAE